MSRPVESNANTKAKKRIDRGFAVSLIGSGGMVITSVGTILDVWGMNLYVYGLFFIIWVIGIYFMSTWKRFYE